MTYHNYTTPLDAAHLWFTEEEKPELPPLTVSDVLGPAFRALVVTQTDFCECANPKCRRNRSTMNLLFDLVKSNNFVCCRVSL